MFASTSRQFTSSSASTSPDPLFRIATRVFKAAAFGELPPNQSTSGYVRQGFKFSTKRTPIGRTSNFRKNSIDRVEIDGRTQSRRNYSSSRKLENLGSTTNAANLISFDLRSVQTPSPADSVALESPALSDFVGVDEAVGELTSLGGGAEVDWGTGEFGPATRYGEVTPGCWVEFRR